MRLSILHKTTLIAAIGLAMIALGGAALVKAQRQPVPRVLRLNMDGAYLGIEMEDVTAEAAAKYKLPAETGVIIRSVEKGSPAEAAGLQANDVLLEYAGIPVFSAARLSDLVAETPANRTVNLGVMREGKRINLAVKTGERSGMPGDLARIAPDLLGRQFGGNSFRFAVPRGGGQRLDDLLTPKPQLGIQGMDLTDQLASFLGVTAKKGVLVASVNSGTPAANVLKAGDVILAVDGKAVGSVAELSQLLSGKGAGSKAELKIVRDKKEMSVTVEFSKPPISGGYRS
jgi:serine protease Do